MSKNIDLITRKVKNYGWGNNLIHLAKKVIKQSNDIDEKDPKQILVVLKESLMMNLESVQELLAMIDTLLEKYNH